MADVDTKHEGGCTCGALRFQMKRDPMFIHCCHCSYCQRETGSSYGLNALVESSEVALLQGTPERVELPSKSGQGQSLLRCSECNVAVWSHYGAAGEVLSFVRVGALDDAASFTPSIHIYTSSKQPWVLLGDEVPSVAEYYSAKEHWSAQSRERAKAMRSKSEQ